MLDRCSDCGLIAESFDDKGRCPLCSSTNTPKQAQEDSSQNGTDTTTKDVGNLSDAQQRLRRAAISAISEHDGVRAAASALGVNHGLIAMARDGKDTPAAYRALGIRKTDRYRKHYEGGKGQEAKERVERLDGFLKRRGFKNLTELVDKIIEADSDHSYLLDFLLG